MPGLTKTYRLRKHRSAASVYEFLDLESGSLIGVAAVEAEARGPGGAILDALLSFRLSRSLVTVVGVVVSPFWFAGAILGIWPLQSRASSPRLIVRRPNNGGIVFTLRVSPGLMYDSRRVDDGQGQLIALFRSPEHLDGPGRLRDHQADRQRGR